MKLITLSSHFYNKYSNCREILSKPTRPYACLEVMIDGVRFAIPFRHHIAHKWAYITYDQCGIDYSKAVVISDERFVGSARPIIEQIEFNALKGKDALIESGMRRYLAVYRKAVRYPKNVHYQSIRRCSSLQYFHSELQIRV